MGKTRYILHTCTQWVMPIALIWTERPEPSERLFVPPYHSPYE